MSKNKIIYNIDNVNMEIDYDKLAEAIVKAQENTNKGSKIRSSAFWLFNVLVYLSTVATSATCVYFIWKELYTQQLQTFAFCSFCTIIFIFIIVYSVACFIESLRDKHSDSFSHFNVNISFIALIISVIALFREVV
ncbi:MAG: hypothetical protein IKB13_03750 [Clostridia bacterium]|nr:hypothetical protein [Clostridia bacterium]